jgi:dCTP deaminase
MVYFAKECIRNSIVSLLDGRTTCVKQIHERYSCIELPVHESVMPPKGRRLRTKHLLIELIQTASRRIAVGLKPDSWIMRMAQEQRMIEPFAEGKAREGVISYGVSSYGYDIRIADEFKIFTNVYSAVVDPKDFDPNSMIDFKGDVCVIPPNSFALARTVEYFRIPRNVLTICVGKSTYARCGIIVNVTPFEPEWEGYVTLEISNTTPLPARIYANEGIAQVLFFEADEECQVSYADKKGKYQKQTEIALPRL